MVRLTPNLPLKASPEMVASADIRDDSTGRLISGTMSVVGWYVGRVYGLLVGGSFIGNVDAREQIVFFTWRRGARTAVAGQN